jgi:hypothetical protein
MKFARFIFRIAGVYGLMLIVPQFFLEEQIGLDYPPPITHPEFFYGFLGVTLAWQVLYLVVGHDPVRYRGIMPLAALAKLSFVAVVGVLHLQGRVAEVFLGFAGVDLLFAVLFLVAYVRTSPNHC